jgi:membrane-associated phospholipid phosphatase
MTAEALRHLGGDKDAPVPADLRPGDKSNFGRLAVWVRGSLYVSEFVSRMSWRVDETGGKVAATLQFDGKDWFTLERPSAELLKAQSRHVRDYAALRDERGAEILSQLGFPTAYFAAILGLTNAEHQRTFELITATQVAAAHAAMVMKIELAVRRPDQVDGRILPMIPTPAHFSFPSAHATEAYAVLTVLEALIKRWGSYADEQARIAMLRGLAERIAVNRTVAGVHFPIDSWAGAVLGTAVGHAVLGRCGEKVFMNPETYSAEDRDFFDHDLTGEKARAAAGLRLSNEKVSAAETSIFSWLWSRALIEKQRV